MTDERSFEVVRLPGGLPEHGVPEGALAVVLDRHTDPYPALEVEVVDDAGRTLFVGSVDLAQVEAIEDISGPNSGEGS